MAGSSAPLGRIKPSGRGTLAQGACDHTFVTIALSAPYLSSIKLEPARCDFSFHLVSHTVITSLGLFGRAPPLQCSPKLSSSGFCSSITAWSAACCLLKLLKQAGPGCWPPELAAQNLCWRLPGSMGWFQHTVQHEALAQLSGVCAGWNSQPCRALQTSKGRNCFSRMVRAATCHQRSCQPRRSDAIRWPKSRVTGARRKTPGL